MNDDLVAFLKARLDEDEETASYAGPAYIAWLTINVGTDGMFYTTVAARHGDWEPWVADGHEIPEPVSARVVYDPARVRREVEAARMLVTAYEDQQGWLASAGDPDTGPSSPEWTRGAVDALLAAIRLRAAVYSDHPDHRPEWKP